MVAESAPGGQAARVPSAGETAAGGATGAGGEPAAVGALGPAGEVQSSKLKHERTITASRAPQSKSPASKKSLGKRGRTDTVHPRRLLAKHHGQLFRAGFLTQSLKGLAFPTSPSVAD